MEIVHITLGKANPDRMNGVNKVVYELCKNQAQAGNDVQFWGITKDIVKNYPDRNFKTKLFKANKSRFVIDSNLEIEINNTSAKTIFHLHGVFLPELYAIARILKAKNKKYIFTPHGGYNQLALEKNKFLKSAYIRLFETLVVNNASFTHCLGQSEMDGTKKVFPNSNTILLPYGFDLIQTKALIEKINTKFIIAFCGRLDMHTKGLDAAIDAFIEFQKNKPHVSLRIIGDGNDRIILQKRAGLAINKIEFCGSKYGDEKIKLLAESHLFIHPSRNEGLPTAVLEAASLGLPSLVTVATNVGTYVQKYNAGVVINSTTNNDVLEGLEKLYANYQLNSAELMNNSKKMVSNEFNWQTIIAQLNSIYKQALC